MDIHGPPRDLSHRECMALLATVPVGRMGVSVDALPAILPINFALLRDSIVIRTVPGTKLDAACANRVVAFEADRFDEAGGWAWSVLVRGVAYEITDPEELAEARTLPLRAWAFPDEVADRFLRITATVVTGRKLGSRIPPSPPVGLTAQP